MNRRSVRSRLRNWNWRRSVKLLKTKKWHGKMLPVWRWKNYADAASKPILESKFRILFFFFLLFFFSLGFEFSFSVSLVIQKRVGCGRIGILFLFLFYLPSDLPFGADSFFFFFSGSGSHNVLRCYLASSSWSFFYWDVYAVRSYVHLFIFERLLWFSLTGYTNSLTFARSLKPKPSIK